MVYPSESKEKENEMRVWTVATGVIDIFKKKSRKAVNFVKEQKGFVGIHPRVEGTLWLFDTKENAIEARKNMDKMGIVTGDNICEVFIDKKYIGK